MAQFQLKTKTVHAVQFKFGMRCPTWLSDLMFMGVVVPGPDEGTLALIRQGDARGEPCSSSTVINLDDWIVREGVAAIKVIPCDQFYEHYEAVAEVTDGDPFRR